MADQKITELPIKTSAQMNLSDYLLGIDSAEGYQMLVSDIAKKIVEDYAGSTLLGQSQSVVDAFGMVKSLGGAFGGAIESNTDLNTLVTVGEYTASNTVAKTVTNAPDGTNDAFKLTVEKSLNIGSAWIRQTLMFAALAYTAFTRYSTNGGSTWAAWVQLPTYAVGNEISANSDLNDYINAGTFRTTANATAGTLANCPVTNVRIKLVVEKTYSGNGVLQTLIAIDSPVYHFERLGAYSSGSWTFQNWLQVPTRAEMDAVSTIKTATITPSTGFESAGFSTFSITQCGRLVVINGYISNLTGLSTSASTEIATFSNVSLPTAAIRVGAIYSAQAYEAGKNAYISFGNNGKIQVRLGEEVTNGKVLYLSASYLV